MSTDNTTQETTPTTVLGRVDEAICALDDDWELTYVNEAAATLVDRDSAALIGESLWEAFPELRDSSASDALHDAVETQEPRRFDIAYDERDAWFTVRAYPSTDGLTVCFHELTDQREQERTLQRSQRLFESVFDETTDALVIADTDHRITDCNPAAERLFGYDASDVLGEHTALLYADTEALERQGDERHNEQAPQRRDPRVVEYERADGTTFDGETVRTQIAGQEGETVAFFLTIRDVTTQIECGDEIERRNHTLRQFHKITTDESDPFDTQVTAVLELAKEYLGLERGRLAEIVDQTHIPHHVAVPEDVSAATEQRPLDETFCERAATTAEPFGFRDPSAAGLADHPAAEQRGIEAYIGVPVYVDGEQYGTLGFASTDRRADAFSESEETFVRIVAQWAGKEISRRQNRRQAREERQRLRQITDLLPQLVFAKDESGTFILANEAVADAYGTTVDKLQGAKDIDFAESEAEAEQFRADDRAVIDSGEPKEIDAEPLTTADGTERIFATKKIPYDPVDSSGDAILGVSTEITELKQREKELEVQSAAMEASMDGISILDADGEYIYMNEAHAAVFDYNPDDLLGSSWRRLYDEEEIRRLEADVFPTLEAQGQWRGETIGRRRDGTPVSQEITLSSLPDGKLICTNRDITERKDRQSELEQYEALVENINEMAFIIDSDRRLAFANETALSYADVTPSSVLGQDVAELIEALTGDGDDSSAFIDAMARTLDGEHVDERYELPLVTPTGEYVMEYLFSPFRSDGEQQAAVVARDITEQKAREQELERQQSRLRALFDESPDGIIVHDERGAVLDANMTQSELLGYAPETLQSMNVSEFEVGVDQPELRELWQGMDIGDTKKVEGHHRHKTGEIYPVEVWVSKTDVHGQPRFIALSRDISERKEREHEMVRNREFLEKTQEIASVGGWEVDLQQDEIRWTDEVYRIHDLPLDTDVTIEDGINYYHPEDRPTITAAYERLVETGEPYDIELRIVTATGDVRWVRTIGDPQLDDGAVVGVRGIFQDITERKQREQDLRDLTERLDLAVEGANLGVWDWDMTTDAVTFNEQWATMLGLELEELEPTLATWEDRVHPADMDRVEDALQAHMTGEAELYDCEHRMQTADGSWKWVRDVGEVVDRDENGDPSRAVGIHLDISDQKASEKALADERDMFAQGPAVVFKWRNEDSWPVEYVSENVSETLGYTPAELESGEVPYETLVHDEDVDRVIAEVEMNSDSDTERFSHEPYRMVTADGTVKWVADNTKVIRKDGEITHYLGYLVDITERKQQQERLSTVQERFERFSETVPNAFFLISPNYETTHYMNTATSEIYGLDTSDGNQAPEQWTEHIHPDDLTRLRADQRAQEAGLVDWPVEQEYRIHHPQQGLRWVQSQIHPVRDDTDAVIELAGVATDITEQKRLEQSLRQSERSLRNVTEVASDTDREFEEKLDSILELGCERLGLSYGFLTRIEDGTQHVVEAIGSHSKLQAGAAAPMSKAYCRHTVQQDEPLATQNAAEADWLDDDAYDTFELGCYIGGKIVVNGDLYGTLCFADRKDRDKQFDESERAFVELLVQWLRYELASDTVETKLRQLNETAQRLLSASDSSEVASVAVESAKGVLDLPLTGIWWYDDAAGKLVPAGATDEGDALVGDQPTFAGGESLAWETFQDGEIATYPDLREASNRFSDETQMRSEIMAPLGEHGILISGSTQQRAFSETDQGLFEILASTVETALDRAEREQILRDTRERLEQSNQELEQFAYAASHDLQEPLRTVSSYLTLLERRNRDELDADAVEFIDFAVDGAERMQGMIQALLEYSRVDTRGQAFEPTDMDAVFRTVTQNLEVTISESGATVDLPASPAPILGDVSQLTQLFQNLVENAVKYSEGEPHVDISVTRTDGEAIEYAVSDNGIGMDPSQLDDIFEVFQRLHTREEFDGTGIGLSICRKIVDRHDGALRVESVPGEGSTFFVTLPVAGERDE
jgi:PAS domain S-box-containing protein